LRILTFTSLYPSSARPQFGIFVETRLRQLVAGGAVSARVVAPCPWFPFAHPRFGNYAVLARIPRAEERHGIAIDHPRYPLPPRIGMSAAPLLMFGAVLPVLRRQIAAGRDFDLIDAHYMYPDGVAAALLGKALGRPVAITSRGTDLNIIAEHALPRRQILWAAQQAAGLVTVSEGLRQRLVALGVDGGRVRVLRNGVDLELFRPGDRTALCRQLGLTGPTLIAVGNLVAIKGHDLMIEALRDLPGVTLLIVGDGPLHGSLEAQARQSGLAERVRFMGRVAQAELPGLYGAADALILASSHEGWPNVLLESMACGTPAVATAIPGAAEAIRKPEAGRLVAERNAAGFAAAVRALLEAPPDRAATRRYAEDFGWGSTTAGQVELFRSILEGRSRG
jgi:glycosyltransferase involved in cell wall biosynthesis